MADTISVAIVALNEEANLPRVLESVRWADEIVLVDSGSTDRTCEIARHCGAQVISEPWRGYPAQKNYALEHCTKDWILSLDADEEVSPELVEEIRGVLAGSESFNGYAMPRRNMFLGRWMRHGGYYPDPKLRLFQRNHGRFENRAVHETLQVDGSIAQLTCSLIHHSYPTLADYIDHMNRYSSLGAEMARAAGHRSFSMASIVVRPLATFIYNYFIRHGFLDGREGLLLHLYHAVYVSWKYAKAWELGRTQAE